MRSKPRSSCSTAARRVSPNAAPTASWTVNQWLKKAVLLSFRLNDMDVVKGGSGNSTWWDKVPSKFEGWGENQFRAAGFRAVPNCVVRRSAYIAKNVVLMPSFVNLGAYVGEGTMVDTWATVGSCAQIGKHVHLSGGVGIGGVLEPMQAGPTIIEDNCFIGARSEVVEGCIVREGSVLGMGVFIGKSTKIVDRATGEVTYGEVPPYSVVVAGSMPSGKRRWPTASRRRISTAPSSSSASMKRPVPRPASTSCCATDDRTSRRPAYCLPRAVDRPVIDRQDGRRHLQGGTPPCLFFAITAG
jgi:2,3,4,5-tetrahydropyridine-2-carboxylate N-succinyltransferase